MLGGYRLAQVVLTANRLDLFETLAEKPLTAQELAARLNSSPRGVQSLADALVALGLLIRKAEHYSNSTFASEHLRPEAARSLTAKLRHGARLYEKWGHLYDAVRSGEPVSEEKIDPRLSGGRTAFAEAMAQSSRESAEKTAKTLDLDHTASLLDIGGGPATFSIAFADRYPDLEVTVMDDEETLRVARRNIREAGLQDRVHLLPGDAFEDSLAGTYDFIFISNLVHIYSDEENARLCRRAAEALVPGGRLCLKDFFFEAHGEVPLWTRLFALNMLVSTEGGTCYSFETARKWLERSSLVPEEPIPVTEKSFLLVGRKEQDSR